jgi:hypothetical protein
MDHNHTQSTTPTSPWTEVFASHQTEAAAVRPAMGQHSFQTDHAAQAEDQQPTQDALANHYNR